MSGTLLPGGPFTERGDRPADDVRAGQRGSGGERQRNQPGVPGGPYRGVDAVRGIGLLLRPGALLVFKLFEVTDVRVAALRGELRDREGAGPLVADCAGPRG